jgi:regulatory protein
VARSASDRREAALDRRARRSAVTDADVVMEAAAAFLAVRPRSVAETRRRLVHLGYPPSLCDEVIDRLVGLGYLDDEAFARAWVESRDRARPRSSSALRRELQQKGVAREVIAEVLEARAAASDANASASGADEAVGVDLQAARRLLARRAASLQREADERRRRGRAYALLARHGFSADVCRQAAAELLTGSSEPEDEGV